MSKRQVIIIVGIWVALFLFLGFPPGWDEVFAVISGIILIIVAYRFKAEKRVSSEKKSLPYIDYRRPTEEDRAGKQTFNNPTHSPNQ